MSATRAGGTIDIEPDFEEECNSRAWVETVGSEAAPEELIVWAPRRTLGLLRSVVSAEREPSAFALLKSVLHARTNSVDVEMDEAVAAAMRRIGFLLPPSEISPRLQLVDTHGEPDPFGGSRSVSVRDLD
jgi:hypothetical protein